MVFFFNFYLITEKCLSDMVEVTFLKCGRRDEEKEMNLRKCIRF